MLTTTIAVAVLAALAQAHNSPHHPAMFGFDFPHQSKWPYGGEAGAGPEGCNWDADRAKWPIREEHHRPESFWLSNGLRGYPPPAGVFLEIESGGTLTLDLNENRAFTRWRWPESKNPNAKWAGQSEGTLHTVNNFDEPVDISLFGGTAIAIAYTSDENNVRGTDFTVISTNWASPWVSLASYPMPSGLPPCPPAGCLCTWNWLHTAGNVRHNPDPAKGRPEGEGYGDELTNVLFRCMVTGKTDNNNVVLAGAVPTQCDGEGPTGGDRNNCTTGPKTPLIQWMLDGNTIFPPKDEHERAKWRKPSYTWRYGFADGAQQDAVVAKGHEDTANGKGAVSDKPRANPFEQGTGGLAVVNQRGEPLWPGPLHADVLAELQSRGHVLGTANATTDGLAAPALLHGPAVLPSDTPSTTPDVKPSTTPVVEPSHTLPYLHGPPRPSAAQLGNVHLAGDGASNNVTEPTVPPVTVGNEDAAGEAVGTPSGGGQTVGTPLAPGGQTVGTPLNPGATQTAGTPLNPGATQTAGTPLNPSPSAPAANGVDGGETENRYVPPVNPDGSGLDGTRTMSPNSTAPTGKTPANKAKCLRRRRRRTARLVHY